MKKKKKIRVGVPRRSSWYETYKGHLWGVACLFISIGLFSICHKVLGSVSVLIMVAGFLAVCFGVARDTKRDCWRAFR